MHPNAGFMPTATALMIGLVAGGITNSALVAGICACVALAVITVSADDRKR